MYDRLFKDLWTRKLLLNFGSRPLLDRDLGILKWIFQHCEMGHFYTVYPWLSLSAAVVFKCFVWKYSTFLTQISNTVGAAVVSCVVLLLLFTCVVVVLLLFALISA